MVPECMDRKQADETAKLICSLLSLIYSMQTGIKSAPANDNFNFEGGDDDNTA